MCIRDRFAANIVVGALFVVCLVLAIVEGSRNRKAVSAGRKGDK